MWPFNRKAFDINNIDNISDKKFIKQLPVFLNKNIIMNPIKKSIFNIRRSIPKQYTYLLDEEYLRLIFERLVKANKKEIFKNKNKLFSFMLEVSTSPYRFNKKGDYSEETPLMKELRSIISDWILEDNIYKEHIETLINKKDMQLLNTLLMNNGVEQKYKDKIVEFIYNDLLNAFNEIKKEQSNENSNIINGLAYDKRMLCDINYKNVNNSEYIHKISNVLINILNLNDIKNAEKNYYAFNKSALVNFTLKESSLLFNPILIDDFFKDITEDKNSTSISNNTLIGRFLNILYDSSRKEPTKSELLRIYFSLAMKNNVCGFIDKDQVQEVFKKADKEIIELIFNKEKVYFPFIFFNDISNISSYELNAEKHYYSMVNIIEEVNPEFIQEMNKIEFNNSNMDYHFTNVNDFDYLYYVFENKYMVNNKHYHNNDRIINLLIKNAENLTHIHKLEKHVKDKEMFSIIDDNIITSYKSDEFYKIFLSVDSELKNEEKFKNIISNEKIKMNYLLNLADDSSTKLSFMAKLLEYYKNPVDEINIKYKPDMEIESKKINACKELSIYFTDKIIDVILSDNNLSTDSLKKLSNKLKEEDNINLFINKVNNNIKEDYVDLIFNNEDNPILKTYFEKRMITKAVKESDMDLKENLNPIDKEQLTPSEPLKKKKRL